MACCRVVRVDAVELQRITQGLERTGRRYTAQDLEGAVLDCDHALFEGHFRRPAIKTVIEGTPMAIYRSHPMWQVVTTEEVMARLEEAWARHGAFENEAHNVTVSDGRVLLDFVTWWDSG